jgi:hypothetical protein
MVDLRDKLGLTGIQGWLFLGCLGGYFALPLLQLFTNSIWVIVFLFGYLGCVVFLAIVIYLSKNTEAAGISVIESNVTTSNETEEEGMQLRVEYPVDLMIESDLDVKLFDDYARYEDKIIKHVNQLLAKKLDVLDKKFKLLLENSDKQEDIKADRLKEKKEIEQWIKDEFNPNPELKTTIWAYWVKLSKKEFFEETPDSQWDKLIIITRRPWESEFPFRRREIDLDGYFIKCKATRAELIKFQSVIDTLPILYSNHTPADNLKKIHNAMEAQHINSVRSRTMSHIIDDYKLQFTDHFSLKEQFEKRLEQEKREKELLEQQLLKAQKQRISTLAQNPIKKSNLAVGLLSLWAFISVLLLIFR